MDAVALSIIIVNWNSRDYLARCLAALAADTSGPSREIIVVDSASFDGCGEMLALRYPEVRFFQSERNIGFGRANNLGARHARAEVLLFLNPDTEVRSGALARLYAGLRELPRAGLIGARLLNSDGSLQTSCVQAFPTILNQFLNAEALLRLLPGWRPWRSARSHADAVAPVAVEVIAGACIMMRREAFEALGGFSPEYFMYAEDLDLCHKSRAAGWLNYHEPRAEIVHHGGGSTHREHSRFASVMVRESVGRLLRKTRGPAYGLGYRLALCGASLARLALLGCWWPVAAIRRRTAPWRGALRKWYAILRWSLGLERWVYDYDLAD